MKKYIKNSIAVIIVASSVILFSSCVKDTTNTTYTGSALIEFANPNYIAPINPIARTVTTTAAPKNDSLYIQLVGSQRGIATNVNFAVDAASTAVAGTDYSITTPSPAVIAANTSGVTVRLVLNKVASQKTLIVNLTGGDNVTPSANYKTFTYTLK
jgi:hypothetical protein